MPGMQSKPGSGAVIFFQLTCWFYDDPDNYRVYIKEQVFAAELLDSLSLSCEARQPGIEAQDQSLVLDEFERLRLSDEQFYLHSASLNRFNGMIGINFCCDGSHYIEHDEFINRLREFGNTDRRVLEKLAS